MCAWPRDLLPIGRPTASSSFFPTADLFLCCGRRQLSCQRIACLARPPFASVDGLCAVYHLCGMARPLISDNRRPGGLGCNRDGVPYL